MAAPTNPAETDRDAVDHAALRLMLSYVEAECLRMGATDAARHAALAAALVPVPNGVAGPGDLPGSIQSGKLH